jgi:transposase
LTGLLNEQARTVNFVWNYCNDRQKDALRFGRRWHTGFDLTKLTTGCSKELGLHSGTVNDICQRYATSRAMSHRPYLRYRGRKAMDWVPLKGRKLKREGNAFRFAGRTFSVFYSPPLPEGKILDGTNFSRDRRGNWFLNIVVEVEPAPVRAPVRGVGIDLGLKIDAGWSSFRTQLAYKAVKHGAWFEEVDERFTTQVCSHCGKPFQIRCPWAGPKGIADLGVREWCCSDCGAVHDRDLNAAVNILRRGRATLAVGISAL